MKESSTNGLEHIEVVPLRGNERFRGNGADTARDVTSFWRWACSDLLNNAQRGVLAEYIVATDLGVADSIRVEWDAYDLRSPAGKRVEVKSSAYLQSWHQDKLSSVGFSIAPTIFASRTKT